MDKYKAKLEQILKELLAREGFKKKGMTWNKRQDDFWILINLQTATWGSDHYVNIGISIDQLRKDKKDIPSISDCQIDWRLEDMDLHLRKNPHWLQGNKDSEPNQLTQDQFNSLLHERLIPLVRQFSSLEDIKAFLNSGPGYVGVVVSAQELFNVGHFV